MKMKKTSLFILTAVVMLAIGCRKEYVEPPLNIPTVDTNVVRMNTTIMELRNMYGPGKPNNAKDTLFIVDDVVIKAIVVANDESGNFYKKIVIQDETAGIDLILDGSYMYNEYPIGQEIYVKCKGLMITTYAAQMQLGYAKGYLSRIPAIMIPDFVLRNGLADKSKVPQPIDLILTDNFTKYQSMLVRINNVEFTASDWGKQWCPKINSFTNRTFKNSPIVVRTGSYANFAADLVPAGIGTITAIVTYNNSNCQLMLRNINDVGEFVNPKFEN